MPEEINRESLVDEEHLRLVSLGFLISAGFAALFACFGLFYILIGVAMSIGLSHIPASAGGPNGPPPAFIGWIFGGMGLVFFLLAGGMAFLRFWAAKCVKRRTSRTYCMVIAGISCLEFPYGTAIGVLSLIVLGRDSVVKLFGGGRNVAAA
jgi:hypothetical protein